MNTPKTPGDTQPEIESVDLSWPIVFSVAGLTLLRSKSVMCQTLGATMTTISLIRLIKKLAILT